MVCNLRAGLLTIPLLRFDCFDKLFYHVQSLFHRDPDLAEGGFCRILESEEPIVGRSKVYDNGYDCNH